jgi:diaminopimelate decarboxylase
LVAASGIYVARIVDVKESRGIKYAVADGGMNHHITATGNFGQVFRKAYPIAVLNKLTDSAQTCVNVVGPCCTPLDLLGQKLLLPEVEIGDLIGVFFSGAYGYSASSLGFLSHPTAAEVLILGQRYFVLRPLGVPAAVLERQAVLPSDVIARAVAVDH